MIQVLRAGNHYQPFKGPFTITRIQPSDIFEEDVEDSAFGTLSNIDHAVIKKGLTIKMHEHVNDEIFSYVWRGTSYHKDSAGLEAEISPGKLMMMNAGESFWHEEKVKEEYVEMLQIFFRPCEGNLPPIIQFHDKPTNNRGWYEMVGPEGSDAPLTVRQNAYVLDAHPRAGDILPVLSYEGKKPFLYVLSGSIQIGEYTVNKKEAVTDLVEELPSFRAIEDTTVVLFIVDMDAPAFKGGTISGTRRQS